MKTCQPGKGHQALILSQAMNSLLNMPFWIYGIRCMDPLEQLAEAALQRDSLRLRSLVQDVDFSRSHQLERP